jgi:hypothetical protein
LTRVPAVLRSRSSGSAAMGHDVPPTDVVGGTSFALTAIHQGARSDCSELDVGRSRCRRRALK